MRALFDPISRRAALGWLGAGAFALRAAPQKGKRTMDPVPSHEDERLEHFYQTETKYHAAPVPTPLDRARAVGFVNSKVNRQETPEKLRKLMRLAVFYDLRECARAFAALLAGGETQPEEIARSAMALIALAWIGDAAQQASAQGYYHGLQDRADIDQQRSLMLEVVEAFGPREGTAYHRQWVQGAIASLTQRLRQAQADHNLGAADVAQEKINALTGYLNTQLARVDRTFSLRQRIDQVDPLTQVKPLATLYVANTTEATPPLSYWAAMRLLRLGPNSAGPIAAEFSGQAAALASPGKELFRARALRAVEFFGQALNESDSDWLATQQDTQTDPLALRPDL